MITGATGQLSRALQGQLSESDVVATFGRPEVDLRDWRAVRDSVARFQPHLVIHAAAHTDVDGCEREPEQAWQINAVGTRYVGQAAALVDAELVYISTNYVFDGTKATPYHEFDTPGPVSVYGASKLAGELEARAASPKCFVVRTAWLYSGAGRNFMLTMRRLMAERERISVVQDQFGNPTLAVDLASAVLQIVDRAPYGTYHAVNSGIASWFDWASEIASQIESSVAIDPIDGSAYPRAATPPDNGSMESLLLPGLGIEIPDWREALRRCLAE
jgi:dTDP-4-dehydrorhamnose reductase